MRSLLLLQDHPHFCPDPFSYVGSALLDHYRIMLELFVGLPKLHINALTDLVSDRQPYYFGNLRISQSKNVYIRVSLVELR